jgi:drug/metabolite transporter (DMT)-like permease
VRHRETEAELGRETKRARMDQAGYRSGLVIVLTAVIAWSTAALFTRLLTVDTPTILFWRGVFGAVGMAALVAFPRFGGLGQFARLGRAGVAYGVMTAIAMVFFVSALRHTSVAHVAVMTATVPLVAALLGWLVLKERPGRSALAASLAALCGVAIMVGLGTEGALFGDMLAALMALSMGVMIIISRRSSFPALHASCLASGLSALFVLPFATLTGISASDMALLALFGLVNQVAGFGLFAVGSAMLPALETALITTLEAPLAPLWVWLVMGERPGTAALAGGGLVLAAVIAHVMSEVNRRD